ncbi:MAG: UDP-glucuronosyltransferase [Thermoproteota archaeon]|nr:UDP-glucuronosyltransferase [Thermoproteota archaeon]
MAFFFASPIGLGHITRDIAILEKMTNTSKKNIDINMVTGLKAFELISLNYKNYLGGMNLKLFNLYRSPEFSIANGELKQNLLWLLRYVLYYKKSNTIVKNFLSSSNFNSNASVIISDEDLASISVAKEVGSKSLFITDILNTSFIGSSIFSGLEKLFNKTMCKLVSSCDCVIVPEFGENKDNIFYVGPIVREILTDRNELRGRLLLNKKTILITTGGTKAGYYLIKRALRVLIALMSRFDFEVVLSYPYDLNLAEFKASKLKNIGFVPNIHEYIFAADLVISLAGKSTIDECIVYGTPGIFIPIKNHFEQEERAKSLGFVSEDIYRLSAMVEESLSNIGNRKNRKADNNSSSGASEAARIISKYLNE